MMLASFLNSPRRPAGTFTYHELRGFLFALACGRPTPTPTWLEVIFNGQPPGYRDSQEQDTVRRQVVGLYQRCRQDVLSAQARIPDDCRPARDTLSNFEDGCPFHQWSRGFVTGHTHCQGDWQKHLSAERLDDLASYVLVLGFFADRELAEALARKSDSANGSLGGMAENVVSLLDQAHRAYAGLATTLMNR